MSATGRAGEYIALVYRNVSETVWYPFRDSGCRNNSLQSGNNNLHEWLSVTIRLFLKKSTEEKLLFFRLYACFRFWYQILPIGSIAFIPAGIYVIPGSDHSAFRLTQPGTICHETPNLSFSSRIAASLPIGELLPQSVNLFLRFAVYHKRYGWWEVNTGPH